MPQLLSEVAAYQNGIKPSPQEKPKPSPSATPPKRTPVTGEESLLTDDNLVETKPSAAEPVATPADDLLAGGNDDLATATPAPSPVESDDLTSDDLSAAPPTAGPAPTPGTIPAEEWVAAGGWYRPQESLSLFYRPVGHADPFLVAWLNTAGQLRMERAIPDANSPFARSRTRKRPASA